MNTIRESHSTSAIEVRFSGDHNENKLNSVFSDFDLKEDRLIGNLVKEKNDFLEWMIPQVSIESFEVKIPTLEEIFIKEVNK